MATSTFRSRSVRQWTALLAVIAAGAAATASASVRPASSSHRPRFSSPQHLPGAAGGTEPQVAVAPDGTRYLITGANTTDGAKSGLRIYRSSAGSDRWAPTAGQMVGSREPGPDVAITVASTGRIVALEEDSAALSLVTNYSDDGGRTWQQSSGMEQLADQDRPWLAAGPHGLVYLLFHNGFSSNATHNMYIETSADGGASFGPPVPITLPGTAAWADLQCADSGGPSALVVNSHTGRLYAVWGTRHGPAGGCGVQPPTPFTLVPANRIWVATSPDATAGSWSTSLAVDDSKSGNVVGMQLSPAALDSAGNVWLAWTTPPHGYPDYSGAGIALAHADPQLRHWSKPLTVVPAAEPGHLLPQLVAGSPGRLALLFLTGSGQRRTVWRPEVAVVSGALTQHPTVTASLLSALADYKGSATAMEGSGCDPSTSPVATVENNPVTCPRSADVIGLALDRECRVVATWPSLSPASNSVLGESVDATWAATQTGGPSLCD